MRSWRVIPVLYLFCAVFLWAPGRLCDLGLNLGDQPNEKKQTIMLYLGKKELHPTDVKTLHGCTALFYVV